jgi:hypothetical protein
MRVLGLVLVGALALTAPIAAHAVPLGSKLGPTETGPAPEIVQVWGGCGWGWHPVPGHWSQWRGGWVPPHCAPNRDGGSWGGPYGGQAAPMAAGAPMEVDKAPTEVGAITAGAGVIHRR